MEMTVERIEDTLKTLDEIRRKIREDGGSSTNTYLSLSVSDTQALYDVLLDYSVILREKKVEF